MSKITAIIASPRKTGNCVAIVDKMVETAIPGRLLNVHAAPCGGGKFVAILQFKKSSINDEGRQRNAAMLSAAIRQLESGNTTFYAVGLAHVLGEDGLVTGLRNAGYTVELVSYT